MEVWDKFNLSRIVIWNNVGWQNDSCGRGDLRGKTLKVQQQSYILYNLFVMYHLFYIYYTFSLSSFSFKPFPNSNPIPIPLTNQSPQKILFWNPLLTPKKHTLFNTPTSYLFPSSHKHQTNTSIWRKIWVQNHRRWHLHRKAQVCFIYFMLNLWFIVWYCLMGLLC